MEDLNAAAPSSTEPSAEELAAIAMGTTAASPQIETKQYADGSSAAGIAPLPDVSTTGAPAVATSGEGSATSDANASAPESSQRQQAISGADALQVGAGDAGNAGNATGALASSSAPSMESPSGSAPAGEAGNDGANAADLAPSTSGAGSSLPPLSPQVPLTGSDGGEGNVTAASDAGGTVAGAANLSAPTSLSSEVSDAATAGASDDPNAGASAAGAAFASDTKSSVNLASQPGVTLAASAFVAERIRAGLQVIREHLWTFERAAVEHLHAELDAIERLL